MTDKPLENVAEENQTEKLDTTAALQEETETAPEGENSAALRYSTEELRTELQKEHHKRMFKRLLRSTVFSLIVVAAASILLAILLLPVLKISGDSMKGTLQEGDIVVALNGSHYKSGDVIAFYYNNTILVKRVIATAGDWVDIDEDGNVYVNNVLLEESYVKKKALGDCNIKLPYQVPDNRVFVMGDQRETSVDSRNTAIGCVSEEVTIGRILVRVWPFKEISLVR